MALKKNPLGKNKRPSRPRRLDPNAWLERAQAIQIYSAALKEVDEKAFEYYGIANEQVKKQFEINRRLYFISIVIVIVLLIASIGCAILSINQNPLYQVFSITGGFCATLLLVVLLVKNPLNQAQQILEKNLRVNVAFLSFVRRLQQSDLALRFVYMQSQSQDFSKVLAQIQDFQNMLDQTSEEMTQILQD
jgi:hypothetical protein